MLFFFFCFSLSNFSGPDFSWFQTFFLFKKKNLFSSSSAPHCLFFKPLRVFLISRVCSCRQWVMDEEAYDVIFPHRAFVTMATAPCTVQTGFLFFVFFSPTLRARLIKCNSDGHHAHAEAGCFPPPLFPNWRRDSNCSSFYILGAFSVLEDETMVVFLCFSLFFFFFFFFFFFLLAAPPPRLDPCYATCDPELTLVFIPASHLILLFVFCFFSSFRCVIVGDKDGHIRQCHPE